VFVPERNLKDLIVHYVQQKEQSISSLTRTLQKDGFRFHRLFLTGYLKALSDTGHLREKEIPPAKVYTVSVRAQSLYGAVGDLVREVERDAARQPRLAVAVLHRIFRRPVFLREVRECGFDDVGDALSAPKEEREEVRKALAELGLKIPINEPAYVVDDKRNEVRDAIVARLLVEKYGMRELVVDTTQTRLA